MATTFTLTLTFTASDLAILNQAGQQIVAVRSFASTDPGNVAWAVVNPLQSTFIGWDSSYSGYASFSPLSPGIPIQPVATTSSAVQFQFRYPFTDAGSFDPPTADSALGSGQVALVNQNTQQASAVLGLLQALTVSGQPVAATPCSADRTPQSFTDTLEPLEKLTLFLSNSATAGAIVAVPAKASEGIVTSPPTTVAYPKGVTSLTFAYQASTGTFVQSS